VLWERGVGWKSVLSVIMLACDCLGISEVEEGNTIFWEGGFYVSRVECGVCREEMI